MRKIICNIFGCNWKYFFTPSDSFIQRTDIRNCRCCGKTQQYKRIPTFSRKDEFVWMNMIKYTKSGAQKYWKLKNT